MTGQISSIPRVKQFEMVLHVFWKHGKTKTKTEMSALSVSSVNSFSDHIERCAQEYIKSYHHGYYFVCTCPQYFQMNLFSSISQNMNRLKI